MLNHKKGDTTVLQAIMWLILALVILVFAVKCTTKLWLTQKDYTESFNRLFEKARTIKSGDGTEIMMDMAEKSAIIGFSSKSDKFEFIDENGNPISSFKRPAECKAGASCICLCAGKFEYSNNEGRCEGTLLCRPKENDNIAIPEILEKQKTQYRPGEWRGGFILLSGLPKEVAYSFGTNLNQNKQTVYIENYKQNIAVCFKGPCIQENQKSELERQSKIREEEDEAKQAIKDFNDFVNFYKACELIKGDCGKFKTNMPSSHILYYNHDKTTGKFGFYLIKGSIEEDFEKLNRVSDGGKEMFYGGMLFKKNKNEIENGDVFEEGYTFSFYHNDKGNVAIEFVS